MFSSLSVLALLLVAVTMGLSLAHALEFPGKLRLDEPTYRAVQTIYYPGFTIGGLVGEFGGMLLLAVLLFSHADEYRQVLVDRSGARAAGCGSPDILVCHASGE